MQSGHETFDDRPSDEFQVLDLDQNLRIDEPIPGCFYYRCAQTLLLSPSIPTPGPAPFRSAV